MTIFGICGSQDPQRIFENFGKGRESIMKRAIACFIALLLGVLLLVQVTPANAATDFIPASLKSVVFDPTYYAANNADVVKVYGTTSAKLYEHFLNYGIKEGRQGSPAFSVKYYWQNNGGKKNPNKAPNYISEMKHFVNSGWKETFRTLTAPHVNIGEKFEARIVGFNGLLVSYSGTNVYADSGTILNKDQIWVFSRNSDGSYRIINKTTGLALSLEKSTYVKDTNVCLKKPTSGKEQRWYIYKYSTDQYVLRSLCTPSCVLDIEGAAPTAGTNIDVWTYNGKAKQIFSIDKVSALDSMTPVDLGNDFYARIINSELERALTVSGTNVVTSVTTGNSSQIWRFQKNSDGTYRIVNYAHNKSLDADGGKYTKRTNVGIKANNNSNAQKWYIFQDGAGYAFLPKCSYSCAMDLQGGSLDNGTNVHLWPYDGNRCKIYDIVKVDVKNKTESVVWYHTPAIPANVGTTLDLGKYSVQFSKDAKLIDPAKITWSSDAVEIVDNKVKVTAKGVYKLVAKYGNKKANVYIVAKLSSESEYVLYSNDFSSTDLSDFTMLISSGTASVSGGKLYMNGVMKALLPAYLADFDNYTITSKATIASSQSNGKWFSFMYRYKNENLYYHYIAKAGTAASNGIIHQKRLSTSSWTYQVQTPYKEKLSASKMYTFKLDVYGKTAEGYINNQKIFRTNDVTGLTKGKLGLQVNGVKAAFDNIKVIYDPSRVYSYMTVNKYQSLDNASNGLLVNGMADFSILASTKDYTLTMKSTKRAVLAKTDKYTIAQGCCSDGTYIYGVIRKSDNTGVIIRKHKLSDGSHVATSKELPLFHGNDLTYDSKNGRIICAPGQSQGNQLFFIDPNTLKVTGSVKLTTSAGAITYNRKYDRYAISRGGKTLEFLNSKFEVIASYTRTDKTGYTAQGMGSDDNYIYFPMSKNDKQNIIVVYDWYGNYIRTIESDVTREAESMFWVNGRYYFAHNYYKEGMNVWEAKFSIK